MCSSLERTEFANAFLTILYPSSVLMSVYLFYKSIVESHEKRDFTQNRQIVFFILLNVFQIKNLNLATFYNK
jgi:hypothetical protein